METKNPPIAQIRVPEASRKYLFVLKKKLKNKSILNGFFVICGLWIEDVELKKYLNNDNKCFFFNFKEVSPQRGRG